jgi:hypothetical protein
MARGDFLHPTNPSRQVILDTIGDQGGKRWRNPIHLREVTDGWPKREKDPDAKERRRNNKLEMSPSHWNGSIT